MTPGVSRGGGPSARLRLALSLVSAAALAYEILLTRLFSIVQWHHFAYMMISVALLGYGAAGAFVTLLQDRLARRFEGVFALCAALFGLSAAGCFLLAQEVPFNALEFLWDPKQPLWLLVVYALLFVPFFFAAICVCSMFTRYAEQAGRIYSFDILGAAAGCLLVIFGLYALPPLGVLGAVGAMALAAAALVSLRPGLRPAIAAAGSLVAAGLVLWALNGQLAKPRLSPYKELSQTLEVVGARVLAETSSPLGLVTVVESPQVPFRYAPGLSLNAPSEPPEQLGLFTDGEGMSAIVRFDGAREPLAYLDYMTSALPYHLVDHPRVLVLGAGSGVDVLQALSAGAAAVDAVELNPQVVDLVEERFASFSGRPYAQPHVALHIGEARGYLAASRQRYDVIQVALLDAFGASSAGLYALSESYLYTVEALESALQRLAPGGYLSITRWVTLPPRDTLKLFGMAVSALERSGISDPGRSLVLIRSWKTATLLIKNGALTPQDLKRVRSFCRERSFDPGWYPGMPAQEAERYNRLDEPYFYDGAVALLGPRHAEFIDRYKFYIAPAVDDRPYFFRFFEWRTLPELLRLKARGGLPLLEWGYPLLAATLVQALLLGLVLILLPLRVLGKRPARPHAGEGCGLLRSDRRGVHVRGDRVHPEVRAAAPSPVVRGGGRAVCVPSVRGAGQPLVGATVGGGCAAASGRCCARARDRRRDARLRGPAAAACASGGRAPRCRTHRARGGAHFPAGLCDGDAISSWRTQRCGAGTRPGALGVGSECVRLGGERGAGHAVGHPHRLHPRAADRRLPVWSGRLAVPGRPPGSAHEPSD